MTEKTPGAENATGTGSSVKPKPVKPKAAKPKKTAKSKKNPPRAKKTGRPAWSPSIAERTTVERMKFCGESEAMIARALKVDVDTLRKHCAHELENGYANNRAQVTKLLFEAAEKGNVSAIARLDEMGKISRAAGAVADRGKPKSEPKPAKLGKKEVQQVAAEKVTGKFAVPEGPKLVVSNK
jgi:hypothetical protein